MSSFIDANNLKPLINRVFGDGTLFHVKDMNLTKLITDR